MVPAPLVDMSTSALPLSHAVAPAARTRAARTSRRWRWLALAVAVVVGLALLPRWLRTPVAVDYALSQPRAVERVVSAVNQGTVRAREHVVLPIEVSARVLSLGAREGERVKAGQVLARLDDREARRQLDMEQARLRGAVAQARLAEERTRASGREHARATALARSQAITPRELDRSADEVRETSAALDAQRRQVDLARESLRLAQLRLDKHVLRAPFAGLVTRLDLTVGELPPGGALSIGLGGGAADLSAGAAVGGGAASVPSSRSAEGPVQIVGAGGYYIEAAIDEADRPLVALGQPVTLTLAALGEEVVRGRVSAIRPMVEVRADKSRDVVLHVEPEAAAQARLQLGMSADVEIIVERREQVIAVPTACVLRGKGEQYVWVLERGHLARRKVEVGLQGWHFTEITGGLRGADLVAKPLADRALVEGERARPGKEVE